MARTKTSARKVKNALRDVVATGAKVHNAKQKRKKEKAKIKMKSKMRQEAKFLKQKEKNERKAAARVAQEDGGDGNDDDDDDDEEEEDYEEGSVETGTGDGSDDESDEGFIEIAAEETPAARAQNNGAAAAAEDGEEDDAMSRMMHESMPWMGDKKGYYHKNLYLCLHDEIMDFVKFMSPTTDELELRSALIDEIAALVADLWPQATLDTFGSHRTQMFLPNSDIDMVVLNVASGTKPLFELAAKLEELDLVSYLEVIDKARIPIVKFVHKKSNIHVDMSFNIAGGLATADLMRHYMRVYPSFRPIVLVLKYFLAQRGLNETYSGGIGSFLLQLMVVSFLQHHRRGLGADHDDPKHNNLGQLLIGFFTLYGRDWNYSDLAISVRNGGVYFYKEDRDWYDSNRPFLISMENPNEPELDVGKNSYEIRTIKRSFEYARQVLTNEIYRRGQFHPLAGSILGTIIPADSHLLDRDGPEAMGYEILHHDPKKTAAVRREYEARRDEEARKKAAEAASKREQQQKRQHRRPGGESSSEPPAKRWRGRNSRNF